MKTATITEINSHIFFSHESFINQPEVGKCRLVSIHDYDYSTKYKYKENKDCTLVSLKPLSGKPNIKIMIDNNSIFEIIPNR